MSTGRLELRPFHPERPGLVAPVTVDPEGIVGPTRGQAFGPHWRRTSRGFYVPAHVELTVEQRIVEAGAIMPAFAVVTGWAALRWWGGRWFEGSTPTDPIGRPVDLAVSPASDMRKQPGIRICQERWPADQVAVVDGLPVAIPVRALAYEMRYASSLLASVTAFDMAAYDDLVSREELVEYAGHAPRFGLSNWTGIPQCREAAALGHENSWSPQEVWLRWVWSRDAELPPPLMNQPVFDLSGRHVGTPDLLDPTAGVAGQYESLLHLEGGQRVADARRDDALRAVGLECFSVNTGESPGVAAARMRAARDRAIAADHPRWWTIEPPPWWTSTVTVAQRRALSQRQRERLLRYRNAA